MKKLLTTLSFAILLMTSAVAQVLELTDANIFPSATELDKDTEFNIFIPVFKKDLSQVNEEIIIKVDFPGDNVNIDNVRIDNLNDTDLAYDPLSLIKSANSLLFKVTVLKDLVDFPTSLNINVSRLRNIKDRVCGVIETVDGIKVTQTTSSTVLEKELSYTVAQNPGSDPNPFFYTILTKQNKEASVTSSDFPLNLRFRLSKRGALLDTVFIKYNPQVLSFIDSTHFYQGNSFHTNSIKTYKDSVDTDYNYVMFIGSDIPSGREVSMYFSVLQSQVVPVDDLELIYNYSYNNCSEFVKNDDRRSVGNIALLGNTYNSLKPSLEVSNSGGTYCDLENDYTETLSFIGYVESNFVYGDFSTSRPDMYIKVLGNSKVQMLSFSSLSANELPTIEMNVGAGEVMVNPITLGSAFDFSSFDNLQYIKISNYPINDVNTESQQLDFQIRYDLENTGASIPAFDLTYASLDATYKETIEAVFTLNTNICTKTIEIEDSYLNSNGQTTNQFDPNENLTVKLDVFPTNKNIYDSYDLNTWEYDLNENMSFFLQGGTPIVYIKESGSNNFLPLRKGATRQGEFYKGISWDWNKNNPRRLLISTNFEVDQAGFQDLEFYIKASVNENASYNNTGVYRSSHPTESLPQPQEVVFTPEFWNVRVLVQDNINLDNFFVNCGALNKIDKVQLGSIFWVFYHIENRIQDGFSLRIDNENTDEIRIKIPDFAESAGLSSTNVNIIRVSEGNRTTENENFNVGISSDGYITITPKATYRIKGFETLRVTVAYRAKQSHTSAEGLIESVILTSLINDGGLPRETPLQADAPIEINLINEVACIPDPPCDNCVNSFAPEEGQEYLLGAWVKVDYDHAEDGYAPVTYSDVGVEISFPETFPSNNLTFFEPNEDNPIIDGWQRIEGFFTVPEGAASIEINLLNNDELRAVYFDDIRIHPLRSNMKSYVYDHSTQRLTAELDENNFATFYEYDDEGNLIRVKKETERGVRTIQETRINQSKLNINK